MPEIWAVTKFPGVWYTTTDYCVCDVDCTGGTTTDYCPSDVDCTGGNKNRILLKEEVTAMTLEQGEMTTGRRLSPVQQVGDSLWNRSNKYLKSGHLKKQDTI